MSTQGKFFTETIVAADDFRTGGLYKAVAVDGTLSDAQGVGALGLAQSQPNSGQHLSYAWLGSLKAFAGAAVSTAGFPLTTAASGYIIAAVSGSHIVGRALETANSGDLFRGLFNFASPRPIGAGSGYV